MGRFDEKLLILDLLSRIMSVHQLILLDFYDFMSRFLQPSQEELHKVLAIIAQSVTVSLGERGSTGIG